MKPMTYDGFVSLRALTDMSISTHKGSWTARLQRAARTDEETSTDRSAYNNISLISKSEVTTYRLRSSASGGHASYA